MARGTCCLYESNHTVLVFFRYRYIRGRCAEEVPRISEVVEQAAAQLAASEARLRALRVQAHRARFLLACAFHTLKDVVDVSRVMRQWDGPQQYLF